MAQPKGAESHPSPHRAWQIDAVPRQRSTAMVLLATGLGLFMIFLDATIVNVALPSIQRDFDVGENDLQWVVAAYSLTMAMFMMTSATFSDSWGRRRAYVVGIVVFSGASLACGLAPSVEVLNATRALQGVGAAIVNVASLALVGAAFPDPAAKAKAVGLWTGIAAVGLAIGPTVGGLLTDSVGWEWIFLLNPIVGLVAVVLTFAFVEESTDPGNHAFDLPGQLLFIAGIGALTFALVQAPVDGFSSTLIIGLLVGSVVVLGVFAWFELRTRDPMMDVRVFADLPYTAAIYTVFAVLFCTYGTLLVITQYFQNVRGYSAEETGLLLLSFSLPSMVMAPIAGRLAARFGGRRPTLTGIALICLATATLAFGSGHDLGITLVGLLLVGFGAGLAVAPATAVAMSSISPDRSGMASGILSAQRALGSTAGFAIMGSLLALVVSAQLPGNLETVIPNAAERHQVVRDVVDASNPQAVPSVIARPPSDSTDISGRAEVVTAADGAFDDGIRIAELSGFVLALLAFVFGWIVFPRAAKREHAEEVAEASELGG
jgi:EmrB/QacA subfamily drug resistance transporter